MNDKDVSGTRQFAILRRHPQFAAIVTVGVLSAIGGALIGGAMAASGKDEVPYPSPGPGAGAVAGDLPPPPPELAQLRSCMEDHGAVLPAPPPPAGDEESSGGRVVLPADPAKARADCDPALGPPPGDAELHARIQRHVECMRDHGVDLPDPPAPAEGPFEVRLPEDDPDVHAATEACDHLLFEDSGSENGR